MNVMKFIVTNTVPVVASTPGLVHHEWRHVGSLYLHKVVMDHSAQKAIEAAFGAKCLPGLNAPASVLSADFLNQIGIVPANGDAVLNILRRWRNACGQDDSFDIS